MDINFATKKLENILNSQTKLRQKYGDNATKIILRMQVLQAAENLAQIHVQKPVRRHELTGKRKGTFAVDLKHPFRLYYSADANLIVAQCEVPFNKSSSIVRVTRA